jgi:hypothetical protein
MKPALFQINSVLTLTGKQTADANPTGLPRLRSARPSAPARVGPWRGQVFAVALLSFCLWAACSGRASTITWTNRLGGDWNTPANWSPHQVPSSSDTALITLAANVTVTLSADAVVGTLDMSGANSHVLQVNGYTLTLYGPVTTTAAGSMIALDSGTLTGTAASSVAGTILWTGGTLGKTGSTLTLAASGVLNANFGTGYTRYLYGSFTNAGTVQMVTGTAELVAAQWYNLPGAVVSFQNGAGLTYSGYSWIMNQGIFRKLGGVDTSQIEVAFTNSGTVDVQIGTLEFSEDGSFNSGTVFTGTGTNLFDWGTFALNTSVTVANGRLAGAAWVGNNGTFNGNWNWTSGTIGTSGSTLTLAAGGVLNANFGTGYTRYLYGSFTNAGTVQMVTGTAELDAAQWYNLPGAVVSFQNSAGLTYSGYSWIMNQGIFRKLGGVDTSQIDVAFTNSGTVDVQIGTLQFSEGGSFNSGTVFTGAGTNLFDWGTFALNTSVTVANGRLAGAAWVGNNGTFNGNWNWTSGTIGTVGSTLTLAVNGVLKADFGAGYTRYLYGVLTNSGIIQMLSGTVQLDAAQLLNLGLVDFVSDAGMGYSGNSWIINQGMFGKSGGSATSQVDVTFTNYGVINAGAATLSFSQTHTLIGGMLNFGLSGPANYGKINLAGSAALTGTVAAYLNNGYRPTAASSFPVLTYGSRTGIFTNTALPYAAAWQTNYAATVFTLSVSNARPLLALIPSQVATQQVAFSVTASATDVDTTQTLTYGLSSPPANMAINPTTGQITWTPLSTQAPSTNTIVVTATDSGTPPLTDTNSFTLTVFSTNTIPTSTFRITSFSVTNGLATLSWTSIPNRTYHLQYKNALTATTWTNVLLDIVATGTTTTAHPTLDPAVPTRFYRVALLP